MSPQPKRRKGWNAFVSLFVFVIVIVIHVKIDKRVACLPPHPTFGAPQLGAAVVVRSYLSSTIKECDIHMLMQGVFCVVTALSWNWQSDGGSNIN